MSRILRFAVIAVVFAFFAGGCASTTVVNDNDIVKQRSEERWAAIFERDYAKAYEYYSPGYRTKYSAVDLEVKLRLQKVRWVSAKYVDHKCEEKVCTVRIQLGYRIAAPVPGVDVWNGWDTIEETWIKTQGEWWFRPTGE